MGHMDDPDSKHTVRIYSRSSDEIYHGCTDVLANDRQVCFTDSTGKRHEVFALAYQITEE